VTGFDTASGFERRHPSNNADKDRVPIIPSLPNRDFRAAAIAKRTRKMYNPAVDDRPKSTVTVAEAKDVIGDTQVSGGISVRRLAEVEVEVQTPDGGGDAVPTGASTPLEALSVESLAPLPPLAVPVEPETEDQRALKELLGGDKAAQGIEESIVIAVNEQRERQRLEEEGARELSEAEALKRDIESRPDESTLDDYARMPVSSFGEALFRGMSASSGPNRKRMEAYVPKARPSLLGIGAKPLADALGLPAGSGQKNGRGGNRDNYKFVPLVRRESESKTATPRERSISPDSRHSSRRHSPRGDREKRYDSDRSSSNRRYDSGGDRDRDRDYDRRREHRSTRYDDAPRRNGDWDKDRDRYDDRRRERDGDDRRRR